MKKIVVRAIGALVVGLACAAALSAQPSPEPRQRALPGDGAPPSTVTVNGTLALEDGRIVLKSGGTSYRVPQVGRYAGFIEGVKEGGLVTVVG
jgi:hypothetical protein